MQQLISQHYFVVFVNRSATTNDFRDVYVRFGRKTKPMSLLLRLFHCLPLPRPICNLIKGNSAVTFSTGRISSASILQVNCHTWSRSDVCHSLNVRRVSRSLRSLRKGFVRWVHESHEVALTRLVRKLRMCISNTASKLPNPTRKCSETSDALLCSNHAHYRQLWSISALEDSYAYQNLSRPLCTYRSWSQFMVLISFNYVGAHVRTRLHEIQFPSQPKKCKIPSEMIRKRKLKISDEHYACKRNNHLTLHADEIFIV